MNLFRATRRPRGLLMLALAVICLSAGAAGGFGERISGESYKRGGGTAAIFASSFEPWSGPTCGQSGSRDVDGDGLLDIGCITTSSSPDPIEVAPALDPTVPANFPIAVKFLYDGPDPVQPGAAPGAFDSYRLSVLRGQIRDGNGNPLEGVLIRALNHPDYGYTFTRADGVFDFVVNGGGEVVLDYSKDGFLRAQRAAFAPWNDWEWVPDATLVPLSGITTTLILGPHAPSRIVRGDVISDEAGTREAVLLVPSALSAALQMHDGSLAPLSALTVRSTEYTVGPDGPSRMPAGLPPSSSYTYAVEFTADEATQANARSVVFDKPLSFYLDNFLEFPVGTTIPAGYYDFRESSWLPSDDGVVVKILSISNGVAELDVDGSGNPADIPTLAGLGIATSERAQLAQTYTVGKELWRTPVRHFTPWDCNFPYTPDPDDVPPPEPPGDDDDNDPPPCEGTDCGDDDPDGPDDGDDDVDEDQEEECGSLIRCEQGSLQESVPVAGTGSALVYNSTRLPSTTEERELRIRLSTDTVPARLTKAEVTVVSLGTRYSTTFNTLTPNQFFNQPLTSADAYGRVWTSTRSWRATIGYNYPAVYAGPGRDAFNRAWARFASTGNQNLASRAGGMDYALSRTWQTRGSRVSQTVVPAQWDATGLGLGGWSLSGHHVFDAQRWVIYRGDGADQRIGLPGQRGLPVVENLVKDFGPTDVKRATRFDAGPDGSLYLIAKGSASNVPGSTALWRYGFDGTRREIVDLCSTQALDCLDEVYGYAGPDVPHDVAVDDRGVVYVAAGRFVFEVRQGGQVRTAFDGAEPQHACGPERLATASDRVYFTCGGKVYAHWRDGQITHMAGGGDLRGPDVPPTAYNFAALSEIAVDSEGRIYVFEPASDALFSIVPNGVVEHVAGDGTFAAAIDGSSALGGGLGEVVAMALNAEGNPVVALDYPIYRIREIRKNGNIYTIAGGGTPGSGATQSENKLARAIAVNAADIDVLPEGSIAYMGRHSGGPTNKAFAYDQAPMSLIAGTLAVAAGAYTGADQDGLQLVSRDGRETYRFDATGRHLSTRDSVTGVAVATFDYNEEGYLRTSTDAFGNVTVLERDASNRVTAIIAPEGLRTELTYGPQNLLSRIEGPLSRQWELEYQPQTGLLTRFQRPKGNASTFTWVNGRLGSDTNAEGGGWTLERMDWASNKTHQQNMYSAMGRVNRYLVSNAANGKQVRTVNRANSSWHKVSAQADGVSTTQRDDDVTLRRELGPDPRFAWDAPYIAETTAVIAGGSSTFDDLDFTVTQSRVATSPSGVSEPGAYDLLLGTTINGRTFERLYDSEERRWTMTSPRGRQTVMELNEQGQVRRIEVAGIAPAIYGYDSKGRLSTIQAGDGPDARVTTFGYDTNGWLSSKTDAENRVHTFVSDAAGRVISQGLPGNRQVQFNFDPNGNVTGITPPGQTLHSFTYDDADRLTKYTPPIVAGAGTNATEFEYNLDGQMTLSKRPDGLEVEQLYSAQTGLLDRVITSSGTRFILPDSKGRVLAAHRYSATWAGPLPRMRSTEFEGASGYVTRHVKFDYDTSARLNTLDVRNTAASTGIPTVYGYDTDSLMTRVEFGGRILTYTRNDGNGLIAGSTTGNHSDVIGWNSFGERASYASKWLGSNQIAFTYIRDKLGRITGIDEVRGGATVQIRYGYDAAGRVDEVKRNGVIVESYGFDPNSNRTVTAYSAPDQIPNGCVSSSSPAAGIVDGQDRLSEFGSCVYTRGANGELTRKSNAATGDIVDYRYDEFGNLRSVSLDEETELVYQIDGLNRRIGKLVNGVPVQGFLYRDQLEPVAELDGNGVIVAVFSYGAVPHVPVLMRKGGATYRIVSDHLGSVRQVVNLASGDVVQEIVYDSYGNMLTDTNPGFQPFGFAGGLYDQDTGLVRFGARDYDPVSGRWTTKDATRFTTGISNLFAYVSGDPVNMLDPGGFAEICSRALDATGGLLKVGRLRHDQIFYDDGSDSGFFGDDRIRPDYIDPENPDLGVRPRELYDDCKYLGPDEDVRAAETRIKENWDMDWKLMANDCQDYAEAINSSDEVIKTRIQPVGGVYTE